MNYTPVIGLEVHVELKTKSKMFCGCSSDYFGKKPNTHTCPVCLGLPGALPAPNQTAIEWCVKIGLALNCEIADFSKFDRKNYFYPDLPKGYQISQYDQPFALNGLVELTGDKKIRIRRVHMEEDTGKLTHTEGSTLIDFNRSGVPLVEIVTEPDFSSAKEVVEYLKKLQQIVRYLAVSNADMEKGDMRLEPNISLRLSQSDILPPYKVEVKNINSFKFVDRAVEFEIKRQAELLDKGETPVQETRGWNETKNATVSQRVKEEAHDYRYFPEPDIPPIRWTKSQISNLKSQIGELPDEKLERFQREYGLSLYDVEILTRENQLADYFEQAVKLGQTKDITPKQIANNIINLKINIDSINPAGLIAEIAIRSQIATVPESLMKEAILRVFSENEKMVEDYKGGKTNVLGPLIGKVLGQFTSKIDAKLLAETIKKMI